MRSLCARAVLRRATSLAVLALLAAGCGDGASAVTGTGGGGSGGEGGQGGTAASCGPTAVRTSEGECVDVGVDVCAEGFEPTADAGCAPVLPAEPCPPGMLALPGDETCREIMDCGVAPWGDVPIEPGAIFVDAAYAGAEPSDGTEAHPFTTISQAMQTVVGGGQVVVAEGHYVEQLLFDLTTIRLWGRCPRLVRITGDEPLYGTLQLTGLPGNHEVHGVRIDGAGFGIAMSAVAEVLLDRIWVTETANAGISAEDALGPVSFTLVDSLVEKVNDVGVSLGGVSGDIQRTEIRDITPSPSGAGVALGVLVRSGPASAQVEGAHLHGAVGAAIGGISSSLVMRASAIHDIAPVADILADGEGIAVVGGLAGPFDIALEDVTIERVHEVGMILDRTTALLDRVTVRDVYPQAADQLGGTGISVQSGAQSGMPDVIARRVSTADTPGFGIVVADANVLVERSLMRRARPLAGEDLFGDGVVVASFELGAALRMSQSRSEDHTRAGVSNFAGTAFVGESVFECNAVDLDGETTEHGPFVFTDEGDNLCGCDGQTTTCKVQSTNLAPPSPP